MNFLKQAERGENSWYLYIFSFILIFLASQLGSLPFAFYRLSQSSAPLPTIASLLDLFLVMISFLFGLIAIYFCVKYILKKKPMDILTARNRFCFRKMFFAAFIWLFMSLVATFMPLLWTESSLVLQFEIKTFFPLLLISLLMFPVQVAFEELVFRSLLLQWVYNLSKSPIFAIVLSAVVFGLMHVANPEVERFGIAVLLPQYILIGILFGLISVLDDGIELAYGLHLANNLFLALVVSSDVAVFQTDAVFFIKDAVITNIDTLILFALSIIFVYVCKIKYKWTLKNIFSKI